MQPGYYNFFLNLYLFSNFAACCIIYILKPNKKMNTLYTDLSITGWLTKSNQNSMSSNSLITSYLTEELGSMIGLVLVWEAGDIFNILLKEHFFVLYLAGHKISIWLSS